MKSYIILAFLVSISPMNTSLFAAPNRKLQEFEYKIQRLSNRIDAYKRCLRGNCSAEEKQIILKAAAKDGLRLALAITIATGIWKIWQTSGIRSVAGIKGFPRKGKFIFSHHYTYQGNQTISYFWNEPWASISVDSIKALFQDLINRKITLAFNEFTLSISQSKYVPGTLGGVPFESDIGKIEQIMSIKIKDKKILAMTLLSSFPITTYDYLDNIKGKTLAEAINLK